MGEAGLEAGDFLLEGSDFGGLAVDDLALGLALAQACGGHSLAYAALGGEFAVLTLDIGG